MTEKQIIETLHEIESELFLAKDYEALSEILEITQGIVNFLRYDKRVEQKPLSIPKVKNEPFEF